MSKISLTPKEQEVLQLLSSGSALDLEGLCSEYYSSGRPKPKHFRGSMRKCVDLLAMKCALLGLGDIDKTAVRGRSGRVSYTLIRKGDG